MNGRAPATFELLAAGNEPLNYEGLIPSASEIDDDDEVSGPVFLDEGLDLTDARSPMFALMRATQQWQRNGATALLIAADDKSPLWQMAEQAQSTAQTSRRGGGTQIPVLLVGEGMWDSDAKFSVSIPAMVHEICICFPRI